MADEERTLFDAEIARDEALERVASNSGSWWQAAQAAVTRLRNWIGTGEDLRLLLTPEVGPPHHHNAWGALVASAVRRKVLLPTGEHRRMRTEPSHARSTPVYRSW